MCELTFTMIDEYADGNTERGKLMRKTVCEKFHFASLGFQTLDGVVRHVVIDEHLKGGAQQNQGQKQYGRNGKEAAAKGTFHPYSTSNL